VLIAAFDATPGPFIALMALGFIVGTVGHLYKSSTAIAIGIGLIFLATLGLPLAIYFSGD
jgi:hypothetical protein